MSTIERRIKMCQFGIIGGIINVAGLVFLALVPTVRSLAGLKLLLFVILCVVYCVLLFAWQLKRLKAQQPPSSR